MSKSITTTDVAEVKEWATKLGGKPAKVKQAGQERGRGILRIDFEGYSGEDTLEEISWEEWQVIFIYRKLAFVYQEKTADGKPSRFFKLVERPGA